MLECRQRITVLFDKLVIILMKLNHLVSFSLVYMLKEFLHNTRIFVQNDLEKAA